MSTRPPLVDRALEASVVGSFTRIGYSVRRRLDRWDDHATAGRGRSVLVTGTNSGIGFATTAGLLARGARVVATARDAARAELARGPLVAAAARESVRLGSPADVTELDGRLVLEVLDLDRLDSARALAQRLDASGPIDVVVHNAGAMFPERILTPDGLERTWQVHVVAPFLLTMLLVPGLTSRPDARVVWVSSGGMYTERLVVRRVDSPRGYRPAVAYARAKRAQVELVRDLHRRLGARTGIAFHAMHPGWARTPGVASSLPTFDRLLRPLLRSPEQGADTIVHLALAPRGDGAADGAEAPGAGGAFWGDRRPRPSDRMRRTVCDDGERAALWERLMHDAGITRPEGPV
jgi:dehydrogenase/reductase SDR family protein 12